MRDLNLMLQNGLQAVFPHVRPIPGEMTLWLSSPSLPLASTSTRDLIATWQERALPTSFISEPYLRVRLDPLRLSWFENVLQTEQAVIANRDLRPAGLLYGLAYWSEILAPATYRLLTAIRSITLWQWCLLPVLLSLALWLLGRTRFGQGGVAIPAVVATTGFAGMVCDLTVVFVLQILYGHVYQHIGLIVAVFMGGLAIGGWASTRPSLAGLPKRGALIGSEIALIGFWVVLPWLIKALAPASAALLVMPLLLLLNAVGGWLVGLQFPLSSQLHLAAGGEVSYTAGLLYAADLLGAFLGAVAVGIALLPILGVSGTCLFVVVLKVCSLALLLTARGSQASQIPAMG
jgi:spermidine synthase